MSKLEDIRRKVTAATARQREEYEADEAHRRLCEEMEGRLYVQFELDAQRKKERQLSRDEELREKYPALKDAYEQYMIVKKMCEANEPKRSGFSLEELKKAFTG